jgi:undecaprenyl diphosphate synthase
MDGNGRWAQQRGLQRIEGHRQGEESIMEAVRACAAWGIRALSLFAFSTENWERPEGEVHFLVNMSRAVLRKRMDEFMDLGVRMRHIGRRDRIPPEILAWFDLAAEITSPNQGLNLSINFNYGGRQEIIDAALATTGYVIEHGFEPEQIDEELLGRHMYAPGLPAIDLLIRTAGEMRVSNFMLWHLADAEILVAPELWPDFRRPQLEKAMEEFRRRRQYRGSDLMS